MTSTSRPMLDGDAEPGPSTTARLSRATAAMATGTLLSRVTGFAKLAALSYALGIKSPLADAYNLANATPNIVFDLIIGGVLAGTVVPVFVERLARRDEEGAWGDISAVLSLAAVVLLAATAALVVLAPLVIRVYTAGGAHGHLAAEQSAATLLLRLFAPQVAAYGLIGLLTAVLNARRRFAAPMFVPIANNVLVIGVYLAVHALFPKPGLVQAAHDPTLLLLLGAGTTGGVVLQALLLVPSLRGVVPVLPRRRSVQVAAPLPDLGRSLSPRSGDAWDRLERLGRMAAPAGRPGLRWRWEPRNEAVRSILRLSGWTFGFVVANQVAYVIVLRLALVVAGTGGISSYTYAYTFFQLPFGIVAVSIMSAVQPELAERWVRGDLAGFGRRANAGLRAVVVAAIPPAVGYLVLA
ncbi:MAG: murein biosynthesis integral membrane protein MurJ, partial [Acidimicrobiales bacterium]